jgi:GH15 family glucan-1,4-alpha-glucosidase
MTGYPAIERHGLIGDLQTAALVCDDGTIDWFCSPRFDSPSLFAALLDADRGGFWRMSAQGDCVTKQLYLPGTPILITRFLSPDGVAEVVDFMPVTGDRATDHHMIVRMVRGVRGQLTFEMDIQPRFNYGRDHHAIEFTPDGAVFRSDGMVAQLCPARRDHRLAAISDIHQVEGGIRASATVSAGQVGALVLETAPTAAPRVWDPDEIVDLYTETREFWRSWLGRSTYRGRWQEMVERSAMTLKLMTYAPTGALVAAPTAGLPEQVGGERNWDYRYTWIRDASFSVYALLSLGFTDEAQRFLVWLGDRVRDAHDAGRQLQIMYAVDGSPDLPELTLDHLAGYRGSSPVRVGNAASEQLQLDIYGEALDSVYLADTHGLPLTHEGWVQLSRTIDWLCEHWDQPDDGIWETRGGRQDFTYGRVMCWVAFDRALRIAANRARPADIPRWRAARDAAFNQVMQRGYDAKRGAFVQHYDTEVLDASLLYLPLIGFISPGDPMWHSTLRAMDTELVSDSLVYRYNPSASPDGLRGSEGTFSMCTFWYVDALARSGRLDDARLTFEKMLTYSSPLGLYSEEIGPTGEQLGNFPQAFSHLALISAAVNLDYQLEHGGGSVDPQLRTGLLGRHRG